MKYVLRFVLVAIVVVAANFGIDYLFDLAKVGVINRAAVDQLKDCDFAYADVRNLPSGIYQLQKLTYSIFYIVIISFSYWYLGVNKFFKYINRKVNE